MWSVLLGLTAAGFTIAIGELEHRIRLFAAPEKFFPQTVRAQVDINMFSASLEIITQTAPLFIAAMATLGAILLLQNLFKKEYRLLLFLLPLSAAPALQAVTPFEGFISAAVSVSSFSLLYVAVTRLIRWNAIAYAVWIWIASNADAVPAFIRCVGSSAAIQIPAAEALFWTVAPPLIIVSVALIRMRRGAGRLEGTKTEG